MIRQQRARAVAFLRSVVLLVVLVVGVPWALIAASRSRFGGAAPLHGVSSPTDWRFAEIEQALTDRLTDQTIADVVIRVSLIVDWVAVIVVVFTVVSEVAHMLRHDGLPMPDLRGLGVPQSLARVIATGLLVIAPMFASPSRATARDSAQLRPDQRAVATSVSESGQFGDLAD